MRGAETVVVVGAGAAGVLTVIRLLELAESRGRRLDVVLADATDEPEHPLTVPAGRLSVDSDDAGDFARWAGELLGRAVEPSELLPRHVFGSYLGDRLEAARGRCHRAHVRQVRDRVSAVSPTGDGVTVRLASGTDVSAAAAVLAVAPAPPAGGPVPDELRDSSAFVADPWAPDAAFAEEGDVLFVGAGPTMVDLAVRLDRPHRRMHAVAEQLDVDVADRLRAIHGAGRLRLHTGEVTAAGPDGDGLRIELSGGEVLRVGTVVDCTGPSLDARTWANPLVTRLLQDGLAESGPHGLGLDTAVDGRLRAGGDRKAPLWTVGVIRAGALWESTTEVNAQARMVAASVLSFMDGRARRRPQDRYGLRLSTTHEAAEVFAEGMDRVLRGQHDALGHLVAATETDPGFALGHAVVALLGLEWGAPVDVAARVREAQAFAAAGDDRERSFVAAVAARAADVHAGGHALLRHIETYPRDALAVNVAVPTISFGGITSDRETWALVESLRSDYGDDWWYLSQLAFVRQDQERWDEAESLASRALAAEPASSHAVHARTHVFYETAEHKAGLAWLTGWIGAWGDASDGRAHFTWHAALHELMLGDDAAVRRRYDRDLAPPVVAGPRALVDSASLLWRCEVTRNWDVRPAATAVLDVSPRDMLDTPATAFAAMHAAIALAAAKDVDRLGALETYAAGHDSQVYRQVVAPLCRGLANLVSGRWAAAVADLEAVRPRVERLGGSAAQREVIEDTFAHALASAGRHDEAADILAARLDRRPHSPLERDRLAGLRDAAST